MQAYRLADAGRFEPSAVIFEQLLLADPTDGAAALGLGRSLAAGRQFAHAERALKLALALVRWGLGVAVAVGGGRGPTVRAVLQLH